MADTSLPGAADPPPVYGLDLETDTATDGLDPRVGRILCVGLAGAGGELVLAHHDEAELLRSVDQWLADLAPGVITTWNGAAFDLPYLATRAGLAGVPLGLRLRLDPGLVLRGDPLPGHAGAYRATWHGHRHLDAYRVFRADVGPALRMSCSLKAVAGLVGLPAVDADASRVHELLPSAQHAYVASDARCTRELALRRWPTAVGAVDGRLPVGAVA
jgi:DNA polymerase elongation subunit (family B)